MVAPALQMEWCWRTVRFMICFWKNMMNIKTSSLRGRLEICTEKGQLNSPKSRKKFDHSVGLSRNLSAPCWRRMRMLLLMLVLDKRHVSFFLTVIFFGSLWLPKKHLAGSCVQHHKISQLYPIYVSIQIVSRQLVQQHKCSFLCWHLVV